MYTINNLANLKNVFSSPKRFHLYGAGNQASTMLH